MESVEASLKTFEREYFAQSKTGYYKDYRERASKILCVTIIDRTEWFETDEMGVNILTRENTVLIVQAITQVNENYDEIKNRFKDNPFGDGKDFEKIGGILSDKNWPLNN